ncbi:MAG: MarR family transcriptional regulator [Cyanobacteriota bacterium]
MNEKIINAQDIFIEYGSMIGEVFGLSEGMAQIVGFLYLSPQAVSLQEICKRLDLTKGTVSLYLRNLESRNIVKRAWVKKKSREKFYEINPNLWNDIYNDIVTMVKKKIELTDEAVNRSLEELKNIDENADQEDRNNSELLLKRLKIIAKINAFKKSFFDKGLLDINKLLAEIDDQPELKKINIE